MSAQPLTDEELLAYLDELLPAERMATVEKVLRHSEGLRHRLAALARDRDRGVHSVGAVWRRRRLSCPSRTEWGSYLLGTLDPQRRDYYEFHLHAVGCRYCLANLQDLQEAVDTTPQLQQRRQKYFQSSAGFLPRPPK